MRLIQVTIGAAATQVTTAHIYAAVVLAQKNTANNCRIGDSTVTTSKGIVVPAGNTTPQPPVTIARSDNRISLWEYFVAGTQNDVVDILYEQG
jgi:hypothetical protein